MKIFRGWLESDMKPAITAGLLLGSALGVIYATSIIGGAYDPWLSSRRAVPVYPLVEAAFWAMLFSVAAIMLGVARAVSDRVFHWHWEVPALAVYGASAALVGVMLVQSEWRSSLLAIIPLGRVGILVFALLVGLAVSRVRPLRQKRVGERVALFAAAIVPLGAAAGLTLAAGVTTSSRTEIGAVRDRTRPNVVLITVDALRSDSVGFMSRTAPTTPSMDRLASEGVVFSWTFAQAPWTLPSFASMMTSHYPSEVEIGLINKTPGNAYPLSDSVPTLADLLSSNGYHTVAQVTNPFLKDEYSVCRGFAERRHAGDPRPYMQRLILRLLLRFHDRHAGQNAEDVTRGAIAWLRDMESELFFMWVHYLDPHEPYGAPADLAAKRPRHDDLMRLAKDQGSGPKRAAARQQLRELYDHEVTYCDRWIGRLLAELRDLGLSSHTAVLLTADHGEAFWERGVRGHGRSFQDEVLRVPLVLALPDGRSAGLKIERPVQLLDIMPTVLDLTSTAAPGELRGRSLLAMLGEPQYTGGQTRDIFAECRMALPERKALRSRDKLMVYQPDNQQINRYCEAELFPLASGEVDLTERELTDMLLDYSKQMSGALAKSKQNAPVLSDDHERELKALGYL